MQNSGNTILITGGGSGIGLGLAEAFQAAGNTVIVAGRSENKLKAAAEKGLHTLTVDLMDRVSLQNFAEDVLRKFPALNVVIHNAGIMQNENLLKGGNPGTEEDTIVTNLLAPLRLTRAFLPHLLKQPSPVVMTVTSGLAFVPLSLTPTYSATKAAIHSYTESLRYQLKDTPVQVIELAPPYVQTHLMGERQASDPHAMPLDEFIVEVMQILREQPKTEEILVKRVQPMRNAGEGGLAKHREFFTQLNDRMLAARKNEF